MLRHKPKFTYKGLTVVLSNPSRFDKINLLSAKGGALFSEFLQPDFNTFQCDIRVREDKTPLIDGTKCIILLGQDAAHDWLPVTNGNNFGSIRGYIYQYNNIPTICSYFPQDAYDPQDYESKFNDVAAKLFSGDESSGEETQSKESEKDIKSRHGKTSRKNWSFWLKKDVERCKHILKHGLPVRPFEPNYLVYPPSETVISILSLTKDEHFYIDLETDSDRNILCFSFAFSSRPQDIYVVPLISFDYATAYGNFHLILRSLAIALRDNITVAHNGSGFVFHVLGDKYHIPVGRRLYDTMLAHHRCFPEVEKSLGHCMSIWAPSEPYHKDEGNFNYATPEQANQLYNYCGKDVFGMILIHRAIEAYAKTKPGLQESIQQANDSIRPYLITSLQGINYEKNKLEDILAENDRLMVQYLRMLEIFIGPENLKSIRGKGKSSMPASNPQCCEYFHHLLNYPVVARSRKTDKPSLAKEAMFKLRLKYENPVIDICIAYRETAKESGSLKFIPWRE